MLQAVSTTSGLLTCSHYSVMSYFLRSPILPSIHTPPHCGDGLSSGTLRALARYARFRRDQVLGSMCYLMPDEQLHMTAKTRETALG